MRQIDMNKISAINEFIDYVAYQKSLKYAEHVIDGIEDSRLEDLSYRYVDLFSDVKSVFDEELKKVSNHE